MRLTVSDRENLRAAIQNYTVNQPGAKKFEIVNYFLKQGYSRSTIFKNIARLAASHAIKDKRKPAAQLLGLKLDQKDCIYMPITRLV